MRGLGPTRSQAASLLGAPPLRLPPPLLPLPQLLPLAVRGKPVLGAQMALLLPVPVPSTLVPLPPTATGPISAPPATTATACPQGTSPNGALWGTQDRGTTCATALSLLHMLPPLPPLGLRTPLACQVLHWGRCVLAVPQAGPAEHSSHRSISPTLHGAQCAARKRACRHAAVRNMIFAEAWNRTPSLSAPAAMQACEHLCGPQSCPLSSWYPPLAAWVASVVHFLSPAGSKVMHLLLLLLLPFLLRGHG